jgi:glycosyltransferase involved in cell wall biosynthesis
VDLAHFPTNTATRFSPCPFVVTVHDTISWDERPPLAGFAPLEALKRWGMFLYNRNAAASAARRARRVITVSENSRRDLVQRLGLAPQRVAVIYEAPAQVFHPIADRAVRSQVRAKFALREPFVLAISSASPRKNARGLVAAFAQLAADLRAAYQLVILWTHGLWRDEIGKLVREHRLEDRVIFLSGVSDDELACLYNEASLFVFPSLYEGFGLPPIEAMACGTPVVASNASSLPEILGDAALLVDPRDTRALSDAVAAVLQKPELARELRAKGPAWVQRYSWERCARDTAQVYDEAYRRATR